MRKLIPVLLFLGSLPPVASEAATYYVGKSGSDSYSCTQAQSQSTPKLTIQAGINCMASGDALQIKAGTYSRPTSNPPSGASWASPTTIQRYQSDTVKVQGWPPLWGSGIQFIVFDGISFDATGQNRTEVITIGNGAGYIRLTSCEVTGGVGTGAITLSEDGIGHNEFINCRIHHNGISSQYDHGIYVKSGNNLIRGNEFDNNAAAGINFYNNGSNMGSGNVATGNSIHDNNLGVFAWDLSGATISNNLIFNNRNGSGISANRAQSLTIYNNTIAGNNGTGIDLSNSSSVVIRNNIVYNNTTNIKDLGTGTIKDHNLCNSGCNVNANPMFVSGTDLRVQSASPAIDSGVVVSSLTTDIFGNPRPAGAAYDIGAHEFGSSSSALPSAPTNVRIESQ